MYTAGKLPIPDLNFLLKKYIGRNKDILIGPEIGTDAAVIKFGKKYLVAKTDPITFTSFDLGEYLVNINANDIACMGGIPRYLLATLLLPERGVKKKDVQKIFYELSRSCKKFGISLCGGHTEITGTVSRPIVIGAMLGEIKEKRRVYPLLCREGDEVLLVKGIAIEGTAILAREKTKLIKRRFGLPFLKKSLGYIRDPGISVLKEAEIAWQESLVKAMHDPTEQGLSGGLYELSLRFKMGIVISGEKIFILPECANICSYFGLNPLGLISSGTLLVVVANGEGKKLIEIYKRKKIRASIIGRLTKKRGVWFETEKGLQPFPYFKKDEITKV